MYRQDQNTQPQEAFWLRSTSGNEGGNKILRIVCNRCSGPAPFKTQSSQNALNSSGTSAPDIMTTGTSGKCAFMASAPMHLRQVVIEYHEVELL